MTRHPTANATQRARRQRLARIDYHPTPQALAVIRANLGPRYPDSILSGVLNRIVKEWAEARGEWPLINNQENNRPTASELTPELSDDYARAYDFGPDQPRQHASNCGAKRHRDGRPCQAKGEPGKRRCRFHGGKSTGPKTEEGKARARANLLRGRVELTRKPMSSNEESDSPKASA